MRVCNTIIYRLTFSPFLHFLFILFSLCLFRLEMYIRLSSVASLAFLNVFISILQVYIYLYIYIRIAFIHCSTLNVICDLYFCHNALQLWRARFSARERQLLPLFMPNGFRRDSYCIILKSIKLICCTNVGERRWRMHIYCYYSWIIIYVCVFLNEWVDGVRYA